MVTPVIMPKFGMAQQEATLIQWLKEEGDEVAAGEPLLEVTTDKVNMDVEAPASGILRGIRHWESDIVPVTETIAYIVATGETWPASALPESPPSLQTPSPAERAAPRPKATPVAKRMAQEKGLDLSKVVGTGIAGRITREDVARQLPPLSGGSVRATPAARRVARESGVDLHGVMGTGPHGRIQQVDVSCFLVSCHAPTETGQVVPLEGIRATIAQRMQHSYRTAPHIHLTLSVDMAEIEAARRRWSERLGLKISLTVPIVKACARALRLHPLVNALVEEQGTRLCPTISIGVAVAIPNGLIVPVLHQADGKGIADLARDLQDLTERAREGRLRPSDVEGGTFTISNLGMFGIESFDPIINPPQAAILGVGAMMPTPVAQGEMVVIRPKMLMTLAADHRVLDGAVAARFLHDVRTGLEDPTVLLL